MAEHPHALTIGTIRCTPVSDGSAAYLAEWVFAGAPAAERDQALQARELDTAEVSSPRICVVVETSGKRVLVDTGIGPVFGGEIAPNLRQAGFLPETIDIVILTHGHPDHVGGAIDDAGKPAFPNARYTMAAPEWRFWTAEGNLSRMEAGEICPPQALGQMMAGAARQCLPPLTERLDLFEPRDDGVEIAPGITAIPAPGHTPYHSALMIDSEGDRLLVSMDTAINTLHLEHPDWYPIFDYDPRLAAETRRGIFDRAAADETLILAYHFPFPGIGRVVRHRDAWRWVPAAI